MSDDDEWQSDRSSPKPRRKRGKRRGDDSGSDWEVEHKKTKKVTHKFGSGSESGSDWGSQKKKRVSLFLISFIDSIMIMFFEQSRFLMYKKMPLCL